MKIKTFCLSIVFSIVAMFSGIVIADVSELRYALADSGSGNGSGFIIDPSKYIQSRYGSGYTAMPLKELKGYSNVYQEDYSIYTNPKKYGEGNCTLSAMLGIMRYLRDYKSMIQIPNDDV